MILFYSKNVKQIPIYFFNLCTSFIVSTLCCCAKMIPFKFLFNSSLEVLSINTLYFDKNIDDIFNLVKYSVYTTQNIFFYYMYPYTLGAAYEVFWLVCTAVSFHTKMLFFLVDTCYNGIFTEKKTRLLSF